MSKHSYPRLIFFIFIIAALSTCQSPKGEEKKPEDDYSFSFRKEQKHFKKASDACKTDSNECASVVIDYLQFKEPTPAFQRINDSILFYVKTTFSLDDPEMDQNATLEDLGNRFIQDYNEYTAEAKTQAEEDSSDLFITNWSIETTVRVLFESPKLVSIQLDTYSYTGGAHPNTNVTLLNYDAITGKALKLAELLKDRKKLVQLVEKKFRENHELAPNANLNQEGFFWEGKFQLPANFGFTREGMLFFYNSYEAAAYAMGPTEFVLNWEELKDLVDLSKVK